MGTRRSTALCSLRHVHWVLGLVDLGYVHRLTFTPAVVEVFTLLVQIFLAAPLVVSVFAAFMGYAVCTLDGLKVLLHFSWVACKEEPEDNSLKIQHILLNHLIAFSDALVFIPFVFFATLKMERRESTSNL